VRTAPATPTASASTTPSASPAWWNGDDCGKVGCFGPQTPGTYASRGLEPTVIYTLADNWVNLQDWPVFFMLYPDTPANRALAVDGTYDGPYILVVPGPTLAPSACTAQPTSDEAEVTSAAFADYVASRNGITARASTPVTVSGLKGLQIDVAFEPAWDGCFKDMPSDAFSGQPDGIRYILLDKPAGGSLMISLVAPADFEAFAAEAMPVVESFIFALKQ